MPKRKYTRPYGPRKRRRSAKKRYSSSRIRKRRFTKAVKKLIQSTAEVKRTGQDPQDYVFNLGNSTMSDPVDLLFQFCSLATGPNDGQRIGERVRTKRAILRLIVTASRAEVQACVLQVFIGRLLDDPGSPPSALKLLGIFDDGLEGAPADGSKISLMRSINRDAFAISHYKKIKIGHAEAVGFSNNDFPAYRMISIDITKQLGVLKYTGSSSIPPNNRHLYMFCNWVDPANASGSSAAPPTLAYYMDFQYTDS